MQSAAEYQRAYRVTNAERLRVGKRQHYLDNIEKYKDRARQYELNNRLRVRENRRRYRELNREHLAANHRAWREVNKVIIREKQKRWKQENKAYVNAQCRGRKARRKLATIAPITRAQIDAKIAYYGRKCVYCSGPYEHLDHVIALARNGLHCLANLRPSCAFCNLSKGNKKLSEWLASRK